MKNVKNFTAIIAAAVMAVSMSSVSTFADSAYLLHTDDKSASVGETVDLKVVIDVGSTGVSAISFKLNYDTQALKLVSAKPGDDLKGWITGDVDSEGNNSFNFSEEGKIGFAYTTMGSGFSEKSAVLINASFSVLKPNAKITFTDVVIAANDDDGTDITDQGGTKDGTIKCSHKNTEEKTTPSTCKDHGHKTVTCKDCSEEISDEELPLTEHTWGEGVETTKPTCTEKGVKTYTCTVCGETKTEEIDALGHDWDEGKTTTEPTCTEKGVKTYTCKSCGETKTEDIAPLGHDWGEWEIEKEPTASEEGVKSHKCSRCGTVEKEAIPTLPVSDSKPTEPTPGSDSKPAEPTPGSDSKPTEPTPGSESKPTEPTPDSESKSTEPTPVSNSNPTGNTSSAAPDKKPGGNTNQNGGNKDTGIVFAFVPAAMAIVGVIISKKRK